ncbi:amyloid beta A4 precursor protein-binding family B member 1-interacting protein-like isoform X2 [Planococcus citri]|uniref:amyloid beta A4 precursor protein-binding family B member 1-interacting protein-like isoform X2 n=1 Tax=Planococcus citri TaxID=170843 RepID=UPI0031F87B8B
MMASYAHQNENIYDTQAEQDLPSPDGPEDPELLLNAWLGELDTLTADLESFDKNRIEASGLNLPRTDTYRFSMANLEDTQDVDLDAILGELCALESQYKEAAIASPRQSSTGSDISSCYRRTTSSTSPQTGAVMRTESPDNDSAFSDSVSLFSSESSTSSSTTPSTNTSSNQTSSSDDSKAEKIKLALQKMKEAEVKKLFVKVFGKDGSAKSLLVDENMKCGFVMRLLADKHHMPVSPRWGIVEYLPELHMERVYEEHEPLVDNLMLWTRDSKNKLFFVERPERLLLFQRPEIFHTDCNSIPTLDDELTQNALVEEYLSSGTLPNVEGPLYIKLDSKKGWKKYNAVLRASGLYYYKEKTLKSTKDLACLATFDVNQVYYGFGWKKKFKAPTEHCFAIKHPCLQQPKSTKYIKYLCAEDALTLHKWVTAIRIIKYGRQLLENYQSLMTADECELSDSGSSGCDVAFESDFPCGTIKRKPPKLPLTATTRQLASLDTRASNAAMLERTPSFGSLPPPPPELLASTLTLNEEVEDLPPPPPPPKMLPSPSATFLQDLQRVMRRKWQVAQKCKQDLNTTPHEVLGFRDPPDYKETNVSNWVAEHYGGGQNLYENVYRSGPQPSPVGVTPAKVPVVPTSPSVNGTPIKKRPPPPPPPRAETTQLTTTTVRFQKC